MRSPLAWIGVAVGIVVLLVATAMIGNRDDSGETVPAGQWAQSVCGSIGVWRGQMESIVDEVRQAPATGSLGTEEPQSQTPRGRTAVVREGLERGIQATESLVTGIGNAGAPDTDQGDAAAQQVSSWADTSLASLEKAQDSLDEEADTPQDAIAQLAGAAGAIRVAILSGFETMHDVALLDPELAAAANESSTCQELREEQGSA